MRRAPAALGSLLFVWALTASSVAAQRRVALCLPEGSADVLSAEARLEFAVQSVVLVACREPTAERIVIEAPEPLARPMASLRRGNETVRTALLREPLDVIDPREFALALSTLLEEAPALPRAAESELRAAEALAEATEDTAGEPPSGQATREPEAPLRRVPTDRSLRHWMVLTPELLVMLDAQHDVLVGGAATAGVRVRPHFQVDFVLRMAGGSEGALSFQVAIGGTAVLPLAGEATALELSAGVVIGLWPPVGTGFAVGLHGRLGLVHEFNDWFGLSASLWATPYWNDHASTVDLAGGISVGPRFEFEL